MDTQAHLLPARGHWHAGPYEVAVKAHLKLVRRFVGSQKAVHHLADIERVPEVVVRVGVVVLLDVCGARVYLSAALRPVHCTSAARELKSVEYSSRTHLPRSF